MTVLIGEDPALPEDDDEDPMPPCVTEAPTVLWLNYGDIERDCTHAECYRDGDVTWCADKQFESDVEYVRADLVRAAMPSNWADDADTLALAKALGLKTPNGAVNGGTPSVPAKCYAAPGGARKVDDGREVYRVRLPAEPLGARGAGGGAG